MLAAAAIQENTLEAEERTIFRVWCQKMLW
jgi:hypothetical protein